MLGEKPKECRESKGLWHSHIDATSEIDSTHVSKMANNEMPVSKPNLQALAKVYNRTQSELLPYWLGQKMLHVLDSKRRHIQYINLVSMTSRM